MFWNDVRQNKPLHNWSMFIWHFIVKTSEFFLIEFRRLGWAPERPEVEHKIYLQGGMFIKKQYYSSFQLYSSLFSCTQALLFAGFLLFLFLVLHLGCVVPIIVHCSLAIDRSCRQRNTEGGRQHDKEDRQILIQEYDVNLVTLLTCSSVNEGGTPKTYSMNTSTFLLLLWISYFF